MSDSEANSVLPGEQKYSKETPQEMTPKSADEGKNDYHVDEKLASDDGASSSIDAVIDVKNFDPVLARKMTLVNSAIDEIGMSSFQWKLFFLNGFGYAVDSLLVVCQSIANPAVQQEYGRPTPKISGIPLASQVGLLVGAGIWGFSADIIGRKLAFNTSLFSCAIFVIIAGGMPNYISFAAMVAIYSAGAGGNFILDASSFLEFLPTSHLWLVTFMATWWAVGYTITGLLAWAFMSQFSCAPTATTKTCIRADNMGWRYLHFTCGALVLVTALARVFLIRMVQTPRWLIAQNRDEEVIKTLDDIAKKAKRPHSLTLEQLQAEGTVRHTELSEWSAFRLKMHFKGLFQTRLLAYSTVMIFANWFVIGMVSPLYSVFLPFYLQSRGAKTGTHSNYQRWRDFAVNHIAGLIGPIVAAILVETKFFGRKGTLAVGALITMVLQFGYTQIQTEAQNLGISAAISAASNIYYGTIYAYTPEILPSAHRTTGYGICVILNRVGGILGVLVGSYADVESTAPLFIVRKINSKHSSLTMETDLHDIPPLSPPQVILPASAHTVRVRAIDSEAKMVCDADAFVQPTIKGHEKLNFTTVCFLIEHTGPDGTEHVLFDCGLPKDFWNAAPKLARQIGCFVPGIEVHRSVDEILTAQGFDLVNIKAMIWSHWHWDHIGDASKYPHSTDIVVGPGFTENFVPGWPEDPNGVVLASHLEGHRIVEPDFPLEVAGFRAHDYFGDGSFYILDVPGHTIGHVCGFARTTPDTFIFMGGDCSHFTGMLRPTRFLPMPSTIPAEQLDDYYPAPCPCSAVTVHHPLVGKRDERHVDAARSTPFYDVTSNPNGAYQFLQLAQQSVDKIRILDAYENIFICLAHDCALVDVLPLYNHDADAAINNWKDRGYKEKTHWAFINELPKGEQPGRPLLTEGRWKNGRKVVWKEGEGFVESPV